MPKIQERKDGVKFIIIPKELADQQKWKAGDRLDLRYNANGRIELFPVE